MNRPELLNDIDRYRLEISDFPNTLDRFIFTAINNLYSDGYGASNIRSIDIIGYLKSNALAEKLMEKENGEVFLQDCESTAEPDNFPYYYNKLKKINFLKDVEASGKDIGMFYCEDLLDPHYSKINEKFETLTVEDILNTLKLEVNSYERKYVLNNSMDEKKATDGVRELIAELKTKPEVGCKLQGEIFNTICRGGRKGKMYLRSAASGVGKAIPNYVKIPTLNGWTTVGEVKVGDYLFDRLGKPTKVLAVYPQEEEKEIYNVYFKSGRMVECCNEHLWSFFSAQNNKLLTLSTKEILEYSKEKGFNSSENYFYRVPIIREVGLKERHYLTPPYEMGLKLGGETEGSIGLCEKENYLMGSIEQRKELLRGLFDSKGENSTTNNNAVFTTHNEQLKDVLTNLVSSLGIPFHLTTDNYGFKVVLKAQYNNKIKMFVSPPKIEMIKDDEEEDLIADSIIKIERTNNYTSMTCFYVDNEEHLFAVGNEWCITHNTRSLVGDACNIAYPVRFDRETQEWIQTGSAEKVLYIMTEQDPDEIQTMILSYLTGYNEEIFLYGTYGEKEMPRIQKAIEIMEKYEDNLLFARIPDPCSSIVKNLFRRYNIQYGVENFFYDYIFSSPAMLSEYRDLKLREDVCLRLFTTTLKNLAIELNSFVLTSTQLSSQPEDKKGGFKDFQSIQGLTSALTYLYLFY